MLWSRCLCSNSPLPISCCFFTAYCIDYVSYNMPQYWLLTFPLCRLIPIEELSVGQISVLKKLSFIKLTALIELYKAKSNMWASYSVSVDCLTPRVQIGIIAVRLYGLCCALVWIMLIEWGLFIYKSRCINTDKYWHPGDPYIASYRARIIKGRKHKLPDIRRKWLHALLHSHGTKCLL